MSADSGPGNREVAYRLFAAEFEDSTVSYSESDEERAPNYVITPTGGRVNRLFLVGVLTETERVGGEQIRGRVVDPTGAFVAYAGQYQPDELAFLDRADPPAFLAVTGKARTFSPEDSDRVYTSVRPEAIREVDAETRDRWVVRTAEQTLDRVGTMASALRSELRGEPLRDRLVEAGVEPGLASGVALAVEHYGTSSAYLQALRRTALEALRVVAGERDEVDRFDLAPGEGGTEDAVLAGLATVDIEAEAPGTAAPDGEPPGTGTATDAGEPTASADPGGAATGATDASAEPEPEPETAVEAGRTAAGAGTEPEPEPGETASEPEPGTPTAATTEPESDTEPIGEDAEPEEEPGTVETGTGTTGADEPDSGDEPASGSDEGFEDFEPGEFELPEEEREEIEAEFGTDFETAGEVEPAGEADIETPEPEAEPASDTGQTTGAAAEAGAAEQASTGTGTEPEPEPEPAPEGEEAVDDEPDGEPDAGGDVDVDEVTVEAIDELDEGDGADREAVVSTVADRYGIDPEAVVDAIDAAMMSGRAYEPSDGRLKAI